MVNIENLELTPSLLKKNADFVQTIKRVSGIFTILVSKFDANIKGAAHPVYPVLC